MELNKKNVEVIAFYLPQYHPVLENNNWFGDGYTEWTNVSMAKPLYKGHYQPRIPADLGYCDLRIPEVRSMQADLAKEAGVSAFCYYEYWFGNGRKILEKPLNDVIDCKEPDFPFCLCWANHSWYKKNWDARTSSLNQDLLIKQEYLTVDDIDLHFNSLLHIFKDPRYFRIDNKLVYVVYNVKEIPYVEDFLSRWQALSKLNDLPGFYFISYTSNENDIDSYPFNLFDSTVLSLVTNVQTKAMGGLFGKVWNKIKTLMSEFLNYPILLYSYQYAMKYFLSPLCRKNNVIPVLIPNWDYTPRRGAGGLIIKDSTPNLFEKHVMEALDLIRNKPENRQILFLKSWNEWGEGNYMEPDMKFGKKYIQALHKALEQFKSKH